MLVELGSGLASQVVHWPVNQSFYSSIHLYLCLSVNLCTFKGVLWCIFRPYSDLCLYVQQEVGWFDDSRHSTGALTTRLAQDASEVKGATGFRFAIVVQLAATLIAALVIALVHNWEMTLVTLSSLPFLIIAGGFQMRALAGHESRNKEQLENAGQVAVEAIDNIRTVSQLGREETFWKKYHDCLEVPYKAALRHSHVQAISFGFSQGVIFFAYGGAFRFGGWQVEHQGYDFEDVFM